MADTSHSHVVQIGYWKTELSPNDWARSKFQDIPSTCYFALVTMTTVGYGDHYPVTFAGKLIAAVTSLSGILVLAIPITVISTNFNYECVGIAGMRRRLWLTLRGLCVGVAVWLVHCHAGSDA